jgi:hypothetical protein
MFAMPFPLEVGVEEGLAGAFAVRCSVGIEYALSQVTEAAEQRARVRVREAREFHQFPVAYEPLLALGSCRLTQSA